MLIGLWGWWIFGRRYHVWIIRWFEFAIGEKVHLLSDRRFNCLELSLLDELSKRIDLLLIEKCDKVVAESTHFRVTVLEKLLNEPFLTYLFHIVSFLKSLELTRSLSESSFPSLLLKD